MGMGPLGARGNERAAQSLTQRPVAMCMLHRSTAAQASGDKSSGQPIGEPDIRTQVSNVNFAVESDVHTSARSLR